jgi:L-lactate dehydrogenase complex protein LldG
MSARDECLSRIRGQLAGLSSFTELPQGPTPGGCPDLDPREKRLALFSERLQASGGQLHHLHSDQAVAERLAQLIRELGLTRIARSDATCLDPLIVTAGDVEWICASSSVKEVSQRKSLFEAHAGLSSAQLGIAETGTLVLDSRVERHRLASLVPPVHLVVLDAAKVVADLGEALAHFERDELPPTLTLITGPSRTADIELELVVGVHGPRDLHVLLLDPRG